MRWTLALVCALALPLSSAAPKKKHGGDPEFDGFNAATSAESIPRSRHRSGPPVQPDAEQFHSVQLQQLPVPLAPIGGVVQQAPGYEAPAQAPGYEAAGVGYGAVEAVGLGLKEDFSSASFDPRLSDPPCTWTSWSLCDAACNGGSAYRLRRITDECAYGPAQQLKVCNAQPCPQDCLLGEWGSWAGGCSVPCGGGERSRQRLILSPALFGGQCEEGAVETEPCNTQECPLDCVAVSDWAGWSECSVGCGGGRRQRNRQVQLMTSVRPGRSQTEAECPDSAQEESCNSQACPIDCVLDEQFGWSQWSECTGGCDGSTQTRHREILTHPQNDGNDCPPTLEIRACTVGAEPEPCQEAPTEAPVWPMMMGDPIILPPLRTPAPLPIYIQPDVQTTTPEPQIPDGFCLDRADGPYEHPDCLCCRDLIMCFQRTAIHKYCPPEEVFVGNFAKCVKRTEAPHCY